MDSKIEKRLDLKPLLDFFGGEITHKKLMRGFSALGLRGARLVLEDDGITLRCVGEDVDNEKAQHALTWLKSVFSPLTPIKLEQVKDRERSVRSLQLFDNRKREIDPLAFEEFSDKDNINDAVENLFLKLGLKATDKNAENDFSFSKVSAVDRNLEQAINKNFSKFGISEQPVIFALSALPNGFELEITEKQQSENAPCLFVFVREDNPIGLRKALILGLSFSFSAMQSMIDCITNSYDSLRHENDILLKGLQWSIGRRPIIASLNRSDKHDSTIVVDTGLCDKCGICEKICPVSHLDYQGAVKSGTKCIRCFDCVEACPKDALRPAYKEDSSMLLSTLDYRSSWLKRLAGIPDKSFPAPFYPSYLLPKKESGKPFYVLGLAIMTMQEHAAVLLKDGEIIGAIEEEKLLRKRHYGWNPPNRKGVTLAIDPALAIEEAFCRKSIRALLSSENITLDDIDLIALNGLPARYRNMFSIDSFESSLPVIKAGRIMAIPHHLCHAASAFRVSGLSDAYVFSVDGRGDRETAALFKAEKGKLKQVFEILSLGDRSIGGVYETVTRLLGFGTHGQGSVMALASFGKNSYKLEKYLNAKSIKDYTIHESGIDAEFEKLKRSYEEEITDAHRDLSASLQNSLEKLVLTLLKDAGLKEKDPLCLAGGVSLNCSMNQSLRNHFKPVEMFVQPAANDAGTALGAALEADWLLNGHVADKMQHAYLGPEFSDFEIESVLKHYGLTYTRVKRAEKFLAEKIHEGKIICWFNGKMEYGPRALGARSILADPTRSEIKDKVNKLKDRQDWRPFGPSILEGYEKEWFEDGFDSRFMLHTVKVAKDKLKLIPAVLHVDNTTRPQVVHRKENPKYYGLIDAFREISGVPMLLNTSFNRRGEPIVCTVRDAVECFLDMGADYLALGNFVVAYPGDEYRNSMEHYDNGTLRAIEGRRRLNLRLTTECDCFCEFCTLKDIPEDAKDKTFELAYDSLVKGRLSGCSELAILRGEALQLGYLPKLIQSARYMGYSFIQLQTNGRKLASKSLRELLLKSGIDAFEINLLSAEPALNDRLTKVENSGRDALLAIQALAKMDVFLLVSIPVLRENMGKLLRTVLLLSKMGVKNVQFNFPRPLDLADEIYNKNLPRLKEASPRINRAMALAKKYGMNVSCEALPFCRLKEEFRFIPDAKENWRKHRIDDLHILHESLLDERSKARPVSVVCRECKYIESCPKTWALYQQLYGSEEFRPLK